MKPSSIELAGVGLLIVYIAFFTHPPPSVVRSVLSNPIGNGVVLLGILYLTMCCSAIIGLFLGIAYVMSSTKTLEYLDPKEQAPPQPKAAGIPPAAITGMLAKMTGSKKGDVRLPQSQGKADHKKPSEPVQPKPAAPVKIENFSVF